MNKLVSFDVGTSTAISRRLDTKTTLSTSRSFASRAPTDESFGSNASRAHRTIGEKLKASSLDTPLKDAATDGNTVAGYRRGHIAGMPYAAKPLKELIPSIEKLLIAQEERIVTELSKEIAGIRETLEFRSFNEAVPDVIHFPRGSSSASMSQKSLHSGRTDPKPSDRDRWNPELAFTEKGSQESKPVSEHDYARSKTPWWSAEKDWFVQNASMLASYIESKGWLKKAPISKAAQKAHRMSKSCFQRFLLSSRFDAMCATAIIAYAVLMGYQVEYMALEETSEKEEWYISVQVAFSVWFALELGLRMWAVGAAFIFSSHWRWNVFDLIIVSVSLVEHGLQIGNQDENATLAVVRVLRVLRLVRALRIIRVVRFFSQLRLMVNSTMNSFGPFFWALCLLLMMIYIVGVQITQNVTEHIIAFGGDPELSHYFGTLHDSVYTLFQMISGGVSWRDPVHVLITVHWSYSLLMTMFVSFTTFAVLNIVTGVFVGSAMHSAQQDQDVVIQDAMHEEDSFAHDVLCIFEEADKENTGFITCEQLEGHLEDPRVRAYLHHLSLDVAEARGLFNLLDLCGTGQVNQTEFLLGCMRLKGPAKNVDVATILYENKRMMDTWSGFMGFVDQQFQCIIELLADSAPMLEPISEESDQPPEPAPGSGERTLTPL